MNKQVTVKETEKGLMHQSVAAPEILKTDLVVPYLTLGQGLSQAVIDRKVQLGDIYKSTEGKKIGDPEHPIEVVFLGQPKPDWVIEQKGKSRFEYRKSEPRHAKNETLPWSFWADDDGNEMPIAAKGASEWRRVKRLTVFAILSSDIEDFKKEIKKVEAGELPDPSKALTPVAISFRSTGYNTGKDIGMFGAKAHTLRAAIWRYQIPMWGVLEQNDQGSYYVWKTDTTKAKPVLKENLAYLEEWVKMLEAGTEVVIHEDGDSGGVAPAREVNEKTRKDVC